MEWRDEGILLAVRKHGENSVIVEAFTPEHGLHAGLVRGGTSRKIAPVLQPGAQLALTWKARLEDQLGAFTVEPVRSRSAVVLSGRLPLAGLNAVAALLIFTLPERQRYARLYAQTERLMDLLGQDEIWPLAYLNWEMTLLEELGYGLDLGSCAVTGATEGLAYISPRTGRAVTRAGAGDYADRLLPLLPCMKGEGDAPDAEVAEALRVTGYFLMNRVAPELGNKPLPDARQRLVDLVLRAAASPVSRC